MHLRCSRFTFGIAILAVLLVGSSSAMAKNLYVQIIANQQGVNYLTTKMIPEFERKFGVKVDMEIVSWTTREQKLVVSTAGGNPPDVFMSGAEHVQSLVQANMVAPIDSYYNALPDKGDFYPPALGSSEFKGHRYGLPIYTSPRVFWYRTDLFEAAGLDPMRPPISWDDMLRVTKRLTRTDGTKVTQQGWDLERWTGSGYASNTQEFYMYLFQNGGQLFDPDTYAATFNSKLGQETLQFMVNLRDAVRPPGYTVDAGSGSGNRMFRGVSAIRVDTSNIIRDFYNPALDLTRQQNMKAMIPPPGQKQRASLVFSDWLGIHAASTQKELAWEFIKMFTSATVLRDYNLAAGYQSPRRSTVRDFVKEQPLVNWVYESLNYCTPFPVFPNSIDAMKVLNDRYVAVMQGKEAIQPALDEAARLWNIAVKP